MLLRNNLGDTLQFLFHAVLLGVIEGITEFLPISSTGHLILATQWLDMGVPGKVFEIVIQFGAILAICVLYRSKLIHTLVTLRHNASSQHFALSVLVAFLPAILIGVLAHGYIKNVLFNPTVVATALILGGLAILLIERIKPPAAIADASAIPLKTALLIGLIQCVAMIPGISRAGATIMGGLMCRLSRTAAAEFSFFLAIPTMLAAASYDLYKTYALLTAAHAEILAVGFVSAFVTALLVVRWLLSFVQHHGFAPFAYYRIALGTLMLWWLA